MQKSQYESSTWFVWLLALAAVEGATQNNPKQEFILGLASDCFMDMIMKYFWQQPGSDLSLPSQELQKPGASPNIS